MTDTAPEKVLIPLPEIEVTIPEKTNIAWEAIDRRIIEGKGDRVFLYYEDEKYRVASLEEAREVIEKEGIKILEIYGSGIWEFLSIPENILESHNWDEEFFTKTAEMALRLAEESSIREISCHLVLYGEKD